MSRVQTHFVAPFVEVATQPERSLEALKVQRARFDELRGDIERFDGLADYARLARAHARAAWAAFLARRYDEALELNGEAIHLFATVGKQGPVYLNTLRRARILTQLGRGDEALAWLEPQTASGTSDARRYWDFLHIAQAEAFALRGELEDARRSVDEVIAVWAARPNAPHEVIRQARQFLEEPT